MRIVIDLQGAQTESRFRGIGRYSLSLAQAIVRNRGEHEIIIAVSGLFPDTIEPIRAAFDGQLPQENIRIWYALAPLVESNPGNTYRYAAAERIREAFLASLEPDIVLITSLFEGFWDDAVTSIGEFSTIPAAVILYDLIPLIHPETHLYPAKKDWYLRKIDHLRRANLILAISESSRKEAIEHLSIPEDKIANISSAADDRFRPVHLSPEDELSLRQKYGLTKPFLLYTCTIEKRKNVYGLIRAFARLPADIRSSHQLAIVSSLHTDNRRALEGLMRSQRLKSSDVILTSFVPDEDLIALYTICKLFVFPSWHEGFGLPALEAMSCGAPVIAASTTSLPEVIGRDDALFDPYSEDAIAAKIEVVLTDEAFREDLIRHGLIQAKKFSWDESARRVIASMERFHLSISGNRAKESVYQKLIQSIAAIKPAAFSDQDIVAMAWAISLNLPESRSKRLFVDVSELSQRDSGSGVQRVTRSILKELLDNPPHGYQVEPVYATTGQPGYRYARNFTQRFRGGLSEDLEDDPVDAQLGDIFLGLDLQHYVVISQLNYLESLRNHGIRIYFVIYDLLPALLIHYFPKKMAAVHAKWLDALSRFDGTLCISRAVADEFVEWLGANGHQRLRPLKIGWFHLGADIENSVPTLGLPPGSEHVIAQLSLRPSFLMVGTIEPRKGHAQTLAAFELLWTEGIDTNLVIIGKEGWLLEKLVESMRHHPELGKRLFWLEGISDEYLEKVYASSTCLIAASEGEGFGLPLIEAAQLKLPIIARDIPVFHEVASEHAFYFSGKEPAELAGAIKEWLMLYRSGQHPRSDNMPWLTWKQSAKQLLDIVLDGKWYMEWPDHNGR